MRKLWVIAWIGALVASATWLMYTPPNGAAVGRAQRPPMDAGTTPEAADDARAEAVSRADEIAAALSAQTAAQSALPAAVTQAQARVAASRNAVRDSANRKDDDALRAAAADVHRDARVVSAYLREQYRPLASEPTDAASLRTACDSLLALLQRVSAEVSERGLTVNLNAATAAARRADAAVTAGESQAAVTALSNLRAALDTAIAQLTTAVADAQQGR